MIAKMMQKRCAGQALLQCTTAESIMCKPLSSSGPGLGHDQPASQLACSALSWFTTRGSRPSPKYNNPRHVD